MVFPHIPASSTGKRSASGGERETDGRKCGNQSGKYLSGLLGPVIGGVMFTLWGIYPILLLSAACFTFSAIMEIFIHIPHEKRPREVGVFRVVGMDLKESYQFVKAEKPIFFSVVFLVSIFNLVLSAVMIVGTPILITQCWGCLIPCMASTQGRWRWAVCAAEF